MKNYFIQILILIFLSMNVFAQTTQVETKKIAAPKTKAGQSKTSVRRVRYKKDFSRSTIQVGGVVWTDNVELKTSDGRSEDVILSMSGFSLGYSYDMMRSVDYGFQLGAKAYFLNGKAKSKGSSIDYKSDSDKIVTGAIYGNALYYPDKSISVGLGLEAMYYKVNMPRPTSGVTIYEFNYASQIQTLYHLELTWFMDNTWSLRQMMFASVNPRVGAGWNVSLGYLF